MNIQDLNNPQLSSWINVPANSDFPIQNIPFGIYKNGNTIAVATIIGDTVIDLASLFKSGLLNIPGLTAEMLNNRYLNDFIGAGKTVTNAARIKIAEIFSADSVLKNNNELKSALHDVKNIELLLPVKIGDYTDFYSSIDHATNVGIMFRDPANALLPNWKHLPVGYHGRSSSIVVSGTDFHRPKGQTKADDAPAPTFQPCRLLDFELEVAFIIGKQTQLGESISTEKAEDHIFGLSLFNDWSARDIQKWEYVPLGPFLAKNFASHLSPWVVTLEALEPFRVEGYKQEPEVLPYLKYEGKKNYDINLDVLIQPEKSKESQVCHSNFKFMYWNMCQQLAHHTVNGCNVNVGDLMASGTISGPTQGSFGSMLELSWQGKNPVKLADGQERKFIQDNDTVIIRGYSEREGLRIGFGEVKAKVLPAL